MFDSFDGSDGGAFGEGEGDAGTVSGVVFDGDGFGGGGKERTLSARPLTRVVR
ncbi:hypothetical protein AGMMS49921_11540 [Endomicrobiia bacterium]|nr:hypothetical protein AGMMS49921_11540 [Endomicrobiia bacterium]